MSWRRLAMALACAWASPALAEPPANYLARPPEQDVIYFVLPDRFANGSPANDRGGLNGDRLKTGFDPASKAFYHGGDLKGLTQKLDYIQALGASAIWVGPVMKNKPVQGPPGQEPAGYHGYWITDFLHVDPHLGTDADFAAFVSAAHARGMKVYMDIICNHTADVIQYREQVSGYPYRSLADYPFSRRGGIGGAPINAGFSGDHDPSPGNWTRLTDPSFAYTPFVPKGEEHAKVPDWLNDPIYYHNRGNSTFVNESATYGDFSGLDDLATENPRVVAGMIDIYGSWIDRFGIDGFRIDTAKHVNPEFWRAFVPAMQARARAKGIPQFHIFGEVAPGASDASALQASWTNKSGLPAVLDFAFMRAVVDDLGGKRGSGDLARLFDDDALYAGASGAAMRLPTFLGNHDNGRFGYFLKQANPGIAPDELLARDLLGHAMLLTLRGIPTIYSGDEQGFAGIGNDQSARQDMFASQTPEYRNQPRIGGGNGAGDHFDPSHPLFRAIARLARLRLATPALTRGETRVRRWADQPGLFAVSRFDPRDGHEVVLLFNTANVAVAQTVAVEPASLSFTAREGACPAAAAAPGSMSVSLPPLGFAICEAQRSTTHGSHQ